MLVPQTLRALQTNRAPLAGLARTLGGYTCGGPERPPPCPPCLPRPPPPCRPRHPHPPRALRVVCCPPRPVQPPPCRPARSTITCSDVTKHRSDCVRMRERNISRGKLAAGGQDIVARRLQNAARTRQLDYEREVAENADVQPPPREPPPAPYALGAERKLLRATDGRLYSLPRTCAERPRCSCTGVPPPPRALTLEEPVHTCHPSEHHPDPCAHQPRIFVEIDRSATSPACDSTSARVSTSSHDPPTPAKPCSSQSVSTSVPAQSSKHTQSTACDARCPRTMRGSGRQISDFSWCKNPLSSPDASQRCRPLTIVERLRARSSRSTPQGPRSWGERRLHTSIAGSASAAAGSFQEMLRSREMLREAGRGRVVSNTCAPQTTHPVSPAGKIELNVPPGTSKVRVNVFLDGSEDGVSVSPPATPCQFTRGAESCNDLSRYKSNDSWLSIRKIQKKITGCPNPIASGTNSKCPERSRSPPRSHRTQCPPPPLCPRCPPSHPKPLPTSPCNKPKRCSSKSFPFNACTSYRYISM